MVKKKNNIIKFYSGSFICNESLTSFFFLSHFLGKLSTKNVEKLPGILKKKLSNFVRIFLHFFSCMDWTKHRCTNQVNNLFLHSSRRYQKTLCHEATYCHHWLIYIILLAATCLSLVLFKIISSFFPLFIRVIKIIGLSKETLDTGSGSGNISQ